MAARPGGPCDYSCLAGSDFSAFALATADRRGRALQDVPFHGVVGAGQLPLVEADPELRGPLQILVFLAKTADFGRQTRVVSVELDELAP